MEQIYKKHSIHERQIIFVAGIAVEWRQRYPISWFEPQ